jgi:hypothetical protein
MLHSDPLMVDIDVNHWRNLQSLILESAKGKRRIVLIHEDGRILKFVHSHGDEIVRDIDRIDDAQATAEHVYRANPGKADFVAVFERRAFDRYFGAIQDTWRADEDLDAFVHRTYAMLDDYAGELVTFPGRAREVLGLQWRVGATYEEVLAATQRFVPPESSVVLGVFDGEALWATLVLSFDADLRADVVTTMDVSRLGGASGRDAIARQVVAWIDEHYRPCRLALFTDLDGARGLLAEKDKARALRSLASTGRLLADPAPEGVKELIRQT